MFEATQDKDDDTIARLSYLRDKQPSSAFRVLNKNNKTKGDIRYCILCQCQSDLMMELILNLNKNLIYLHGMQMLRSWVVKTHQPHPSKVYKLWLLPACSRRYNLSLSLPFSLSAVMFFFAGAMGMVGVGWCVGGKVTGGRRAGGCG